MEDFEIVSLKFSVKTGKLPRAAHLNFRKFLESIN